MTFHEAQKKAIETIQNEAIECSESIKSDFKAVENLDPLGIQLLLEFNNTFKKYVHLKQLNQTKGALKGLNTVFTKHLWRTGGNLENLHFEGYTTAPNPKWTYEIECSYKDMEALKDTLYQENKKDFHTLLARITNNKSLANRYTKHIFGSSIKH